MAGTTESFGAGEYDFWLVRADENGDSLWSRSFGGMNNEWSSSIIQTGDGGFSLTGNTESFGAGSSDFWLVKTGPDPVSVPNDDFILHPSAFILWAPYPNPFNGFAVASYEVRVPGWVNLSVYDGRGGLVRTLVDGWQPFGKHRIILNAAGLPAGTYLVRLTDNRGEMAAQPVVLMK